MTINQTTLLNFLTTVRPANSVGEKRHVNNLIKLIGDLGYTPAIDAYGNITVNTLTDNQTSRVMFASHTDSIHRSATHSTQSILVADGIVTIDPKKTPQSTCLGADDATGNYIMLRLLQARAPGLYVFFRDEEIGGLGSDFYAKNPDNRDLIGSLTHCISFDRKGYDSIITHQSGGRCASDQFAKEFGALLSAADSSGVLNMSADDSGSFTDSANFDTVISECTNLSVGYFSQHTMKESQDIGFAEILCNALAKLDWTTLPHYRDPKEVEPFDYYKYDSWRGGDTSYDDGSWYMTDADIEGSIEAISIGGYTQALELVMNDPTLASDLLDYLINR